MREDDYFDQHTDLLKIRFNAWLSQFSIKDSKVLDLGCGYADTGVYVLENGASKYVGVDMDSRNIEISNNNLKQYSNVNLINSTVDEFLKVNKDQFDIILVGALIHGMGDVIDFFKKLSEITDRIVIETAHPFHSMFKKYVCPSSELYDLEYNTALIECHESPAPNHLIFLHSIKYLITILNRLGFTENLSPYEKLKKELPQIYKFDLNGKLGDGRRYVLFFEKVNKSIPITWEDTNAI
jgi:ubiquinone/menaquinone biosynthesis C-methylase UbiE